MTNLFRAIAVISIFLTCAKAEAPAPMAPPECTPPPAELGGRAPSACVFYPQDQWQRCCVYQDLHLKDGRICDILMCSMSCTGTWEQGPTSCVLPQDAAY